MPHSRQQSGYCTNVHAGPDLPRMRANLEKHALEVKRQVSPDEPMGVGLWLAAPAAKSLRKDRQLKEFADWLRGVGLIPFTFNGFPHGDFHQKVVKHHVYVPTWADPARLDYTLDLIQIQHALLPAGMEGSISTLPIAWGEPMPEETLLRDAAQNLATIADALARLEAETGRLIYLCLEPEPGCVLDRKDDLIWFFEEHLDPLRKTHDPRRYLRVCHDVCHSVVMFEEQEEVLRAYHAAGIAVGKVQVSSAIRVDFAVLSGEQRLQAVEQLRAFAEDRYLHQTMVKERNGSLRFHQDLPSLLREVASPQSLTSEWRIHFHVPVYLDRFGQLASSRDDIQACMRGCAAWSDVKHFEVETYAWSVLPRELQQASLADGIAAELRWFWENF